jgi:4-hydroxy-3-methylbut-2-enyl diphosphate reductase
MHVFNNLIGGRADQYNDPDRALFYERHRLSLGILAILAGLAGLLTAYTMGRIPFFILLAMSVTGFSYNLRIIPNGLHQGQYARLRDIPGSKTVLIAIAWGIVTSIIPVLALAGTITMRAVVVFVWAICMVFVRTAFFDILDMQGDRIVGRETIPIILGDGRTMRLLKVLLGFSLCVLMISSIFSLVTSFGFVLTACSIFLYIVLVAHERGRMLPGIGLEFLVDTHFVLSGILTILWSICWFGSI